MLWLPVLLASHSSLAAADSVAKSSAPPAPQRRDSPAADTTARDPATKPPRNSASPDATMKLWPEYVQSGLLVSEAAPEGRVLSEVCGACTFDHYLEGNEVPTCCDALWTSHGFDCATLFSSYGRDCSGCNCPGDPSPPPSPPSSPLSPSSPVEPPSAPSPPSLPTPPSPPPATARSVALGVGYCRDASGSNPWDLDESCLDTVQECGQACETTTDCACFAHTSPAANPDDADGCKAADRGRCRLTCTQTDYLG